MNKKTIVSLTIIPIGITGLVWWSKTVDTKGVSDTALKSHPARIGSILVADGLFYDFGKISMKDGNVSKVFKVTNTGSVDASVSSVYTSCMCTNAYILSAD